eukprot:scaffold35698_cov63-Attheya_sp.AAC.19
MDPFPHDLTEPTRLQTVASSRTQWDTKKEKAEREKLKEDFSLSLCCTEFWMRQQFVAEWVQ